jgi:squalene synthase HpnC
MLSLDACYAKCRSVALSHYENFPVGSILMPKKHRKHVYALYAFMRVADDVADTPGRFPEEKLALLQDMRNSLVHGSDDPIIRAVRQTLEVNAMSPSQLERLLDAFEFDAKAGVSLDSYDDLRWYTARSAEPVGELILALFGYRDETRIGLSNEITSALQLLNFVQDLREDLGNGRSYLPKSDYVRCDIPSGDVLQHPNLRTLLAFETDRVESMLNSGKALPELVKGRLRFELRAIILAAQALVKKMRTSNWVYASDSRPVLRLSGRDKLAVLLKALFGGAIT